MSTRGPCEVSGPLPGAAGFRLHVMGPCRPLGIPEVTRRNQRAGCPGPHCIMGGTAASRSTTNQDINFRNNCLCPQSFLRRFSTLRRWLARKGIWRSAGHTDASQSPEGREMGNLHRQERSVLRADSPEGHGDTWRRESGLTQRTRKGPEGA